MNALSLFSGIGGLDLAGEWAGINTVAMCEREPFPRRVLAKHWPGVPIYDDVCTLTREVLERDGINTDAIGLISAGFPCQPFSHAGNRAGTDDERYLWPEVVRVVDDVRPPWFVGENVTGLLSMANENGKPQLVSRTLDRSPEEDFYEAVFTQEEIMLIGRICQDLEDIDYKVQVYVVPAAAVGAVHQRYRVIIVGNTERSGCNRESPRRAESKPPDGYTQLENGLLGHASSKGLPQRGRPVWAEGTTETGTGLVEQSERSGKDVADTKSERWREGRSEPTRQQGELRAPGGGPSCTKTLADSESKRLRETRRDSERSSERIAGGGVMADADKQHGDDGGHGTGQIFGRQLGSSSVPGRKALADSGNSIQQERHVAAVANRSGHGAGGGNAGGNNGPAQPGLGGGSDELSARLDRGINPLDDLTDFIATYPQPAPMGCEQYDWEPSRVAQGVPDRAARLKALGNAIDPLQFVPIMTGIKHIDDLLHLSI